MLAETCKWTLIGKFERSRPQIDQIRADFAKIVQTKGHVKIGAKDSKHVFIDVENEEDYNTIVSYNFILLGEDINMKILRWTTDFKLNASSTLAPVWINLPDLPWHYYEWAALCRIVEPIGDRETLQQNKYWENLEEHMQCKRSQYPANDEHPNNLDQTPSAKSKTKQ